MMEALFLAIALSMDAVAVSITIGIYKNDIPRNTRFYVAMTFGLFQGGMIVLGYLLAFFLKSYVEGVDHWIALLLLSYIGMSMLYSAYKDNIESFDPTSVSSLLMSGVATSIDAMAIGITLATLGENLLVNSITIGLVTFILSFIGVNIGKKIGIESSKYSLIIGGCILIAIGIKIFVEHTFL